MVAVFALGGVALRAPAGSTGSTVTGIGPAGQIVGTFVDASGKTHGFEYVSGTYYQIDVPNSTYTRISGVSSTGMIFGYYTTSQGSYGYVGTCPKKEVCTQ
jgi:probable HAF family extracellular repeat protein